jgi:MoxR-like ATPase
MASVTRNSQYQKAAARIPVITEHDMMAQGYYMRPGDAAWLADATHPAAEQRCLLFTGNPGVGKSQAPKTLSHAIAAKQTGVDAAAGCAYLELNIHSWTSNDEVFVSPHIGKITVGGLKDPKDAYRPGILFQAAVQSWHRPVVVLLDEFDKCQERTENLFLSWMEDGRVQDSDPNGDGDVLYADLSNIIVVLTSNGTRDLGQALLDRVFAYHMNALPKDAESRLLRQLTGAPVGAISPLIDAANLIRKRQQSFPSVRGMSRLLRNASIAPDEFTIGYHIKGLLAKQPDDMNTEQITDLAKVLFDAFGVKGA